MIASSSTDLDEPDFDPRVRLGACLADKWTLEEVLGHGGMAVVYGATHRNGHRTAIKMLWPHIARDESLVRRFLREGYLANKVRHDGAVRVLDDGRAEDGSPFLVMERLDGYTLDAHLERGKPPLDIRDSVDLMLELLEILEAAHGAGMVHRDIKPANIFRTVQGKLKLLDFGIALLVEAGPSSSATLSGTVIGTPAFMAPEQARGRKELVGPRSDLWAVAASGLSLMIGRRLRTATTAAEELAMAALQPLPPASTFGEGLRGRLGDALDRALAFEPRDRFSTAAEMRDALLPCREDAPQTVAASSSSPAFPSADTVAVDKPRAPAATASPTLMPASRSTNNGVNSGAPPAPAVASGGSSSSRGWLVPVVVAAAVALVAIGINVVKRPKDENRPPAVPTSATAPPRWTAPPPSAAVDPSLVAPTARASQMAPLDTGSSASPTPPFRPRATGSGERPGARPPPPPTPSRPVAKPDFMDER